jgi:predicted Zn-dependent peptidase
MIDRLRGAFAALFLSGSLAIGLSTPVRADEGVAQLAPGETVLPDGLTAIVKHATASGSVALEIWIRCPADGWSASEPGIARLAAYAAASSKSHGISLRDLVRADGAQLSISVFQSATEIAILAPSYAAADLQDALVRRVLRPLIDSTSLDESKVRLAAQQAAAAQGTDSVLREGVFSSLFAAGPMHDSTFGDPKSLKAATVDDVRSYAYRAYVPAGAIYVAVGDVDAAAFMSRLSAAAPPAVSPVALPASQTAAAPAGPVTLPALFALTPGVALAWVGPPIADQRAATAMDFLSDYLADTQAGTLARAAAQAHPGSAFSGQFITLENPGVFFVSAAGEGVDPATMSRALQDALRPVLAQPLPRDAFSQALSAFQSRLLRQMDSPQGLADNYGWYFAQGASAYAPSATDADLGGAYFANAAALTPGFVHDIARRYLGAPPVTIVVTPHKRTINVSTGGS